ncbi:hypothetical protein COCON_G00085020 [Conger conger]|uniref:Uncharacterized protein n=1 Tax=Conger conger TaxID=82655 RepID=A0A9Q1DQB1_CONCO|nr:hypothetical protein COCON_G00085020 [Conger conger]
MIRESKGLTGFRFRFSCEKLVPGPWLVLKCTAYLLVENFQKMNEGLYYCVNETDKRSGLKLEIQKVYQEPAELMEGENGSVVCNVSQAKEGTRLFWIEVESQQKFASADGFGIEFALSVINVTLKRSAWVCAVFYKDRLRALLPLNLTIKRQGEVLKEPRMKMQ